MVNTKEQGGEETIRSLVSRLLEKRGLRYTSFDVFPTGGGGGGSSEKPLDLASHYLHELRTAEAKQRQMQRSLAAKSGASTGIAKWVA